MASLLMQCVCAETKLRKGRNEVLSVHQIENCSTPNLFHRHLKTIHRLFLLLLLRLSYTVTILTARVATPLEILCCKANWTINWGEAHFLTFELTTVPTHQKTPRVRTLAKHALDYISETVS